MRTALLARFIGGPLNGQRRALPGDPYQWKCATLDRDPAAYWTPATDALRATEVSITYHRYRRTNDWRADGSVTFLYEGEH